MRKSYGRRKPIEEWEVLLKDHHEGYIDWAEFERNQHRIATNAFRKAGGMKSGTRRTSLAQRPSQLRAMWPQDVGRLPRSPAQSGTIVVIVDNSSTGLSRCQKLWVAGSCGRSNLPTR